MHKPLTLTTFVALLWIVLPAFGQGGMKEEVVEYELPTGEIAQGVLIYDEDVTGMRPGILVVPEWWGLTEYPKMRARELAEEGYIAFVADMYGNGVTTGDPAEAGKWSGMARETGLAELVMPAMKVLVDQENVDDEAIGAIGFCFGGSTVVDMATSDYGSKLKAVVSFHGGLSADAAPQAAYNGPAMLILHGGADPMVKPDAFAGFVQKSLEAGVPMTLVNFPTALHAFSNPDATMMAEKNPQLKGAIAYDEQAAKASIEIMDEFFEMIFGDMDDDD